MARSLALTSIYILIKKYLRSPPTVANLNIIQHPYSINKYSPPILGVHQLNEEIYCEGFTKEYQVDPKESGEGLKATGHGDVHGSPLYAQQC